MAMCAWEKKKQPIYTDHAQGQMVERRITKEEVEFCFHKPEITRHGEREALILTAHPNGRFIKVVVSRKKPRLIITVAD